MEGRRLDRHSWIAAGLDALLAAGPEAVAVQPLARAIGATKGSFYWHFAGRSDLLAAVLERWYEVDTERVIADVERHGGPPAERIRRLLARVTAAARQEPGELTLSAGDPQVAPMLARVTERRIAYVAALLVETGLDKRAARRRAILAYTAFLGHAQLARSAPGVLPRSPAARRALLDEEVTALIGRTAET